MTQPNPVFTSEVLATYQTVLGGMLTALETEPPENRSLDWIFRKLTRDLVDLRNVGAISPEEAAVVFGMIENLADNVGFRKTGQWPTLD